MSDLKFDLAPAISLTLSYLLKHGVIQSSADLWGRISSKDLALRSDTCTLVTTATQALQEICAVIPAQLREPLLERLTSATILMSATTTDSAAANVLAQLGLDAPPEPLHADLQRHVQNKPITMIHHPLMIWLGYAPEFNNMINRCYLAKKELYAERLAKRDWRVISSLVEKPYRMEKLIEHYREIPESDWWPLLADVWTSIENVWQYQSILPAIFRGRSTTIREMHNEDEWAAYEALPATLQVYRGCKWHNRHGWSWTLDREQARFFARRFMNKGQRARIMTCTIEKESVLYYTDCRKERECVIRCGRSSMPAGTKMAYCD